MNHGWTYTDRIGAKSEGSTVLDFYSNVYRHSTRETWLARIEGGEITLNGTTPDANDVLSTGDLLLWRRPPWEEGDVPRNYKIVHEDDSIIAVDKPAGLPVVPDGGYLENTLVHMLSKTHLGEKPAPAHRLNRGTSGIVIFARNAEARRSLTAQFRDFTARRHGTLRKTYLALTAPYPSLSPGACMEVTTPIGEIPHPLLGRVHAAKPDGRPSLSICRVIEQRPDATLWSVELVTGRPHQIRIHLASIGVPIIGDKLFLPGGSPNPGALPGDCGFLLHSLSITFAHPATGKPMTLSAEPPAWAGPRARGE